MTRNGETAINRACSRYFPSGFSRSTWRGRRRCSSTTITNTKHATASPLPQSPVIMAPAKA